MKLFNFLIKRNKLGGKQMTLEEIKKAISGLSEEEKAALMESMEKVETPPAEDTPPIDTAEPTNEPENQEVEPPENDDVEADKKLLEPLMKEIANIKAEIQAMKENEMKEKQTPKKAPDGEAEKLNKIAAKYSSD